MPAVPFASVVVPVLNSGASLEKLLQCLQQQDCQHPFEVIVVDDGSSEDLQAVISRFRKNLSLKFLRHEANRGPAAARNSGIKKAIGEIVVFTDADCRPQTDWLEKMLAPFADQEITGVKGAYACDQTDTWAQLAQLEFEERYDLLESQPEIDFIDTYSGAYRRRDLLKVDGFAEEFIENEDVDLAFRVKKLGGRFVFARAAQVFHQHREGWLNYARLKFGRGFWRMKVYGRHPEKAVQDSYTPLTLKLQLLLVLLVPLSLFKEKRRFWWKTLWLFSCLPLLRLAFAKKMQLVLLIPLFCLVRAIALMAGMAKGFIAELSADKKGCP